MNICIFPSLTHIIITDVASVEQSRIARIRFVHVIELLRPMYIHIIGVVVDFRTVLYNQFFQQHEWCKGHARMNVIL